MHRAMYVGQPGQMLPLHLFQHTPPVIILQPSHPTAPVSITRHLPHGVYPAILEELDDFDFHHLSSLSDQEAREWLLAAGERHQRPRASRWRTPPQRPVLLP